MSYSPTCLHSAGVAGALYTPLFKCFKCLKSTPNLNESVVNARPRDLSPFVTPYNRGAKIHPPAETSYAPCACPRLRARRAVPGRDSWNVRSRKRWRWGIGCGMPRPRASSFCCRPGLLRSLGLMLSSRQSENFPTVSEASQESTGISSSENSIQALT